MQSDNIVEQADKSASKIGKFNTAEDLLAAYNALESEFTKRCQLIKQLQTELNALRAQACEQSDCTSEGTEDTKPETDIQSNPQSDIHSAQPPEHTPPVPEVGGGRDECAAITAEAVLNEILQNACEYAEALSAVPEIMSACIASYKQRLLQPHPAPAPAGMAVIVPAKKPKTLMDAKRLADAMLGIN